ncbi:MAG: hypothetical protein V4723_15940 [Pseudomonadota bacterium]
MKTVQPARLLKFALYADAAASVGLGVLQLLLPSLLTEQLRLPTVLLTGTGLFLLAYALVLVLLASARQVWAAAIRFIVIGNVGWALACCALLLSATVAPSPLGTAFIAVQAGAVLVFAYLERAGLRESLWDGVPQARPLQA